MTIVGITGGSGAGKSFFCSSLNQSLNSTASVISLDSYYKGQSLSKIKSENLNFDHPDSIDYNLLFEHIIKLKNGEKIRKPVYSFHTQNRTKKTITVYPKTLIFIEGILTLNNEKINDLYDMTIFLDIDKNIRLKRIIERDINERGRSETETIKRFNEVVEPMFNKYIYPLKNKVDFILNSSIPNNFIIKLFKTKYLYEN